VLLNEYCCIPHKNTSRFGCFDAISTIFNHNATFFGAIERLAACSKLQDVVLIVENPLQFYEKNNCVS
jgi:hypothetical protein